jgi:hypothetical protein
LMVDLQLAAPPNPELIKTGPALCCKQPVDNNDGDD